MRVTIVGDLQNDTFESVKKVALQINELSPDYVITVGDYGTWNGFGAYESFKEIADAFKAVKCRKFIPLLGNHDIQYESGEYRFSPGTISTNFEKAFGHAPDNETIEIFADDNCKSPCAKIACVHLNPQSKADYVFFHECHVDDNKFDALKTEVSKDPDCPVIIVTHAPPAGAEMLCVPSVHVRAGNAYMDQDHDINRWATLARENRNVVLWLCGHYHVGHNHKKSTNVKDGVTYMMVGSPVKASRDGQHHTRVLDFSDSHITVSTFDHDTGSLSPSPDAIIPLLPRKAFGEYDKVHVPFCVACGRVVDGGFRVTKNGRAYIHTDAGILWEVDLENRVPLGSLHYSEKYDLEDFAITEKEVFRFCRSKEDGTVKVFAQQVNDVYRFMREYDYDKCAMREVSENEAAGIIHECAEGFGFDETQGVYNINGNKKCKVFTDDEDLVWIDIFDCEE